MTDMEGLPGKILIVDDEPDIVAFLSYNLKNKGYQISTASDGVEAIRKAREFKPDLILLDVMMPNKDGIATIRELRQMPEFEDTAIILLTALDLEINKTKFTVSYKGEELTLAKKEFELLSLLASKPGRVFLRNEILQRVWGTEVIVGDRTIDVHIRKIRQKIGIDLITTVKGVGYKFEMA